MAIYYSTNPLDWFAADGTYVAEQNAPALPQLEANNVVQLVGDFPIGEPDRVYRFSDTDTLVDTLIGPTSNPEAWSGVRAILGKFWGILEIVRIDATGATAASRTVDADGYVATAKNKGDAGEEITILHTNNGDSTFDVTVTWNGYSVTYAARTLADVADIADDYVSFATTGAADTIAATDSAAVALSGGDNGTPVDADYVGGVSDVTGLRLFESKEDGAIVFLAEHTSAAAITALRAHAALKRCRVLAQAATANVFETNRAAAAAINDDRLILALHRVNQLVNGTSYVVDLVPFAAAMMAKNPPHFSIADKDFAREQLGAINSVAGDTTLERGSWIAARKAGGIMLEALEGGGFRFTAGLTTSTTAGLELITTRSVKDIATNTVVQAIAQQQGKPGMPFYERIALSQAKDAINVLKGNPETNPLGAILEDGGAVLGVPQQENTSVFRLALSLWGETRFQIITITSGVDLDIEETLAA